jgi:Holliday junction resolvasome RuvABC DNA-binding subunit
MDKDYLMEMKLSELQSENQKQVFFRYLSIAEHYIFTENEKEGIKILKSLGFDRKTIKSFIKTITIHHQVNHSEVKEIMMGKVPKKLLN